MISIKWLPSQALKSRETRQMALQCIVATLLQETWRGSMLHPEASRPRRLASEEGQQHSNLLVATVSKLIHGLRVGEGPEASQDERTRSRFREHTSLRSPSWAAVVQP